MEDEEALPLRPMTQITMHSLPGPTITLFGNSSDGGYQSEVRGHLSARGDYLDEEMMNDTGFVELVNGMRHG